MLAFIGVSIRRSFALQMLPFVDGGIRGGTVPRMLALAGESTCRGSVLQVLTVVDGWIKESGSFASMRGTEEAVLGELGGFSD